MTQSTKWNLCLLISLEMGKWEVEWVEGKMIGKVGERMVGREME